MSTINMAMMKLLLLWQVTFKWLIWKMVSSAYIGVVVVVAVKISTPPPIFIRNGWLCWFRSSACVISRKNDCLKFMFANFITIRDEKWKSQVISAHKMRRKKSRWFCVFHVWFIFQSSRLVQESIRSFVAEESARAIIQRDLLRAKSVLLPVVQLFLLRVARFPFPFPLPQTSERAILRRRYAMLTGENL